MLVTAAGLFFDGDLRVVSGLSFDPWNSDLERAVVSERRRGAARVDGGTRRQCHVSIECEAAAGKPHLESLVKVPEPVDPDLDFVVLEPDLDVAGRHARGVEDREVGVLALEEVDRERPGLLGTPDRATDCLDDRVPDGFAEFAYHSSMASSDSVSWQYGQTKSATPTSSGIS